MRKRWTFVRAQKSPGRRIKAAVLALPAPLSNFICLCWKPTATFPLSLPGEGEATHSASSSKLRYTSSSFSVVSSEGKGLGRKGMTGLCWCLAPHSRAPELSPALSILLRRTKYALQIHFCPRMASSLLLAEGRAGRAGQESRWGGWLSTQGSTWAPK